MSDNSEYKNTIESLYRIAVKSMNAGIPVSTEEWISNLSAGTYDDQDVINLLAERDVLQARIAELEEAQRWIPVDEKLPVKPGEYSSEKFEVQAQEFGCEPVFAICNCWISADHPLFPKWYLDREFYNLLDPSEIAQQVKYYRRLPPVAEAKK